MRWRRSVLPLRIAALDELGDRDHLLQGWVKKRGKKEDDEEKRLAFHRVLILALLKHNITLQIVQTRP